MKKKAQKSRKASRNVKKVIQSHPFKVWEILITLLNIALIIVLIWKVL